MINNSRNLHFSKLLNPETVSNKVESGANYLLFNVVKCFYTTLNNTRLSYYNVTTRLVDLVGLCCFKQN